MNWVRSLLGVTFGVVMGCTGGGVSSDGGVVGSGISAMVTGNVVDAQADPTANGGAGATGMARPPIHVSIAEAPGVEAAVDPNDGTFQLSGEFSGPLTVRFAVGHLAATPVTYSIDVPEGSTVVLQDIHILAQQVQVRGIQQLHVFGHVSRDGVDCATGRILFTDDAPDAHPFVVRMVPPSDGGERDGTEIVRPDGQAQRCSDIHPGDSIAIDAGLRQPGAAVIDAVRIVVAPGAFDSAAVIPVRRVGTVVQMTCEPSGFLQVQSQNPTFADLFAIDLGSDAKMTCTDPQPHPCQCSEVAFGDRVMVDGLIEPDDPGVIHAAKVAVSQGPPSFAARLVGVVEAIDCEAGTLQVDDPRVGGQGPSARLTDETVITCRGMPPQACQCTDIAVGDHVSAEVTAQADPAETLDAVAVVVLPAHGRMEP